MSLIDWSDPDEMLGLLLDYVLDEATACQSDRDRARFLRDLSAELRELSAEPRGAQQAGAALQRIRASQPDEFEADKVISHLDDCIEELTRIEHLRHI